MQDWLANLEQRERLTLIGGAIVLGLALLYVLLVQPLFSAAEQRAERVATLRSDLVRARQIDAELATLAGQSTGATSGAPGANQSMLLIVQHTARDAGLSVRQTRPLDESTVRVRFETASFDDLVQWMGVLATRYGIEIDIASFDRTDLPGIVDAQVTLERPTA